MTIDGRPGTTAAVEALASRLCRECALCCDGSFFARVPLAEGEASPPALRVVVNQAGGRYVPQPCSALVGQECSCYEARPKACQQYRCTLVIACVEGEVSLREALKTVVRARDFATMDDGAKADFYAFAFGRR